MQIFIDADSCPVIEEAESVAGWHNIPVTLLCDTNHVLTSEYSEVITVGAGTDAVDYALIKMCQAGDVVITQDYGVAAMAISRGAYAIHQNGWQYTEKNIDGLLTNRRAVKMPQELKPAKGARKRTEEDDENFVECLDRILSEANDAEQYSDYA